MIPVWNGGPSFGIAKRCIGKSGRNQQWHWRRSTARLLRDINLPLEWQTCTGGFDAFMCEGFRYGGVNHNLDQANRCAAYPFIELSWDRAHCRYLMGLYLSGWPWQREYLTARRTGVPLLKTWAYDHICLLC